MPLKRLSRPDSLAHLTELYPVLAELINFLTQLRTSFAQMIRIVLFFCLIAMLTVNSYSQDTKPDAEQRARREAMRKKRDSLLAAREKQKIEQAINRLKSYEKNTRIDTVKYIDLSDCGLKALPGFIRNATACEKLILDNNAFHKLPNWLNELTALKTLQWDHNVFDDQVKIPKITHIKEFRFRNNRLKKTRWFLFLGAKKVRLPWIRKLKHVEHLYLEDLELTGIPLKKLGRLHELKRLVLDKNPLQLAPDTPFEQVSQLHSLKMNFCDLKVLPPTIAQLDSIRELQVMENELTHIPERITELKKLEKLSLYENDIARLPKDIFRLPRLKMIDLYHNELSVIPAEVHPDSKIRILYASHNKIYDVPGAFATLDSLEELYLHHNRISVLPAGMNNLKKLRVLRLNHNYLSEFPDFILKLKNLEELDVTANDLSTIPTEITELKKLSLFTFRDNNIDLQDTHKYRNLLEAIAELNERGVITSPSVRKSIIDQEGE